MSKYVIVITGQTATGKTKLALTLSKKLKGELVNADSRQVYKGLDIITGKDLALLRRSQVPLHLFDVVTPDEEFSSHDFVRLASAAIHDIIQRGKTPVIVGGTYFYLQHLLYGVSSDGYPANPDLRAKLNKKSLSELQAIFLQSINRLKQKNNMNESDWNNPRRLIRKIEILSSTISPSNHPAIQPSNHLAIQPSSHPAISLFSHLTDTYDVEFIGLRFKDKEKLVKAIEKRVRERMAQGALEEVKGLLSKGYGSGAPGLATIGYNQLIAHLEGKMTLDAAIEEWITKEVQYAKRQHTFMKKDSLIKWRLL